MQVGEEEGEHEVGMVGREGEDSGADHQDISSSGIECFRCSTAISLSSLA